MRALAEEEAQAALDEAQSASQQMWQKVRDECATVLAETERLEKLRDLFSGLPVDEPDSPDSLPAPEAADGSDPEATAADAAPESDAAGDMEGADPAPAPAAQTGSEPVTPQPAQQKAR